MFLKDKPHPPSERHAAMPELLQDYKAQHVRLLAQTRELERLRQQVRASAEREAAAIVTAARRDVRQVLVDARRELLILVAQLQAVGCDTQAEDLSGNVVQAEATSSVSVATRSDAEPESFAASQIVSGARRDVREVLIEAQTELVALADEARELRARIARQHSSGPEFLPESRIVPEVAEEPPALPLDIPEPPAPDREAPPESPGWRSALWPDYTPVSSAPRVWAASGAAVVFLALALTLFLSFGRRTASPDTAATASPDAGQTLASRTVGSPPALSSPLAPPARDPSMLAVTIDVKRPAWIRTTIDGRSDSGRVFDAGESRTLTARDEIVMRASDAGAVLVSVNGAQPTTLGGDGRVVTRRFGNPSAPPPLQPAVLPTAGRETPPSVSALDIPPTDVGTTGTSEAAQPLSPEAMAEREILRAAQRWFEAYFGADAASMKDIATSDFSIVDERAAGQRVPAAMQAVNRGLQQVRIEVAGEGAVMSARLSEQITIEGQRREYVSLVSGVWIRTEGRWRLMGVRFIDPPSALR